MKWLHYTLGAAVALTTSFIAHTTSGVYLICYSDLGAKFSYFSSQHTNAAAQGRPWDFHCRSMLFFFFRQKTKSSRSNFCCCLLFDSRNWICTPEPEWTVAPVSVFLFAFYSSKFDDLPFIKLAILFSLPTHTHEFFSHTHKYTIFLAVWLMNAY